MSDKPKVVLNVGEDNTYVETEGGEHLCTIDRDDDSFNTAMKIFAALKIGVVIKDQFGDE